MGLHHWEPVREGGGAMMGQNELSVDCRFSGVWGSTVSVLHFLIISQVAESNIERDSHEETVLKLIQSHVCMVYSRR